MSHPELLQLLEYLEQPESAQHVATLDHLTDCAHCRTRAARLEQLQRDVRRHAANWSGESSPRSELHAAVHGAALQRELSRSGTMQRAPGWLQRVSALFSLQVPVWMPAAATAALVIAVISTPWFGGERAPDNALVAYRDTPVMVFQSGTGSPPGLGFFAGANRIERPFENVDVARPAPRMLTLTWPAVDNAVEYRVTVNHIDGETVRRVAESKTIEPQVRIDDFEFTTHRRYEWVIEGTTGDGTRFSTAGGFLVP